jgi:XapX domain-containing protein
LKSYFMALAVGWLVGLIYRVSGIRSPAPPVVALVGLLGILAGESTMSYLYRVVAERRKPMAAPAPPERREGP